MLIGLVLQHHYLNNRMILTAVECEVLAFFKVVARISATNLPRCFFINLLNFLTYLTWLHLLLYFPVLNLMLYFKSMNIQICK